MLENYRRRKRSPPSDERLWFRDLSILFHEILVLVKVY
jgi:hypothetical protein